MSLFRDDPEIDAQANLPLRRPNEREVDIHGVSVLRPLSKSQPSTLSSPYRPKHKSKSSARHLRRRRSFPNKSNLISLNQFSIRPHKAPMATQFCAALKIAGRAQGLRAAFSGKERSVALHKKLMMALHKNLRATLRRTAHWRIGTSGSWKCVPRTPKIAVTTASPCLSTLSSLMQHNDACVTQHWLFVLESGLFVFKTSRNQTIPIIRHLRLHITSTRR